MDVLLEPYGRNDRKKGRKDEEEGVLQIEVPSSRGSDDVRVLVHRLECFEWEGCAWTRSSSVVRTSLPSEEEGEDRGTVDRIRDWELRSTIEESWDSRECHWRRLGGVVGSTWECTGR